MPGLPPRLPAAAAAVLVLAACGSALAACGSAAAPGAAPATAAPTPTTSAASSTTTPSTTLPASTAPSGVAFLTAWGATLAQWNANHTEDPAHTGYWPRLPDNIDTYTAMQLRAGRVVGYLLSLYPPVPVAAALSRLANDLPLDARVVSSQTRARCDQVVESGPTMTAATGSEVVADLESAGPAFRAGAVIRIAVAPLPAGAAPPAACAG